MTPERPRRADATDAQVETPEFGRFPARMRRQP